MAIYSNLTVDQGSPFSATITVNDDSGNVKNLTGFTYAAKAKRTYESETAKDIYGSCKNNTATLWLDKSIQPKD